MPNPTPRQLHADNLTTINGLSAYQVGKFFRSMTYEESQSFLNAYDYYYQQGYPDTEALQRAWDHYYAAKIDAK